MVSGEVCEAIWWWLPARTDRRRVTHEVSIAVGVGQEVRVVARALAEMERGGYVIRNVATGRQTGWHRGKPLPCDVDVPDISVLF